MANFGTPSLAPHKSTPQNSSTLPPHFVVFFAGPTAHDEPSADLLAAPCGVTLLRTHERGMVELVVEVEGVRARVSK